MKTKKPLEIEFYDDAEDMSIKRFNRFSKYLLIDLEIGNTFEDYDLRTQHVLELLHKRMIAEAAQELNNRRQAVFHIFEEHSPRHYALAIAVKSINGKVYTDYSEKTLQAILKTLDENGYTEKQLKKDVANVKKKSTIN